MIYQKVLKAHIRATAFQPPKNSKKSVEALSSVTRKDSAEIGKTDFDIEKATEKVTTDQVYQLEVTEIPTVKLTIRHVNFFRPLFQVLMRKNNFLILLSSGSVPFIYIYNLLD